MPLTYNTKTGFPRNTAREHSFAADRVYHSGEIIQILGRLGIVTGEKRLQIGEEVNVCFDRTVDVQKLDPSTAFVAGAAVGYHDITVTANPMVADVAGAGTFDIGFATKDSPAGQKFVEVIFPLGIV